ncbi:P-loop protein, PF10923 family [Leptospira yanagawae serovar Saopaulo str. Sao Paulo = ATCC 700523]|uniref:P-loop protein, PF10923 family n=1 Tax=Leptospira yanagawae serovar Saopaulo str. Sao Paulo = ATCC 700523 TaxID=1249483 RepID=A0A5E8HHC9_9LEPT|nr:BREX system ATP-binding protein BrxD [Leptospira yanagawae]EOQ90724.1 P-loop protein, PF10923 family [Leptospira yanagawae serovar Saopaulo str. Sao Paulo = ATCC 700523]
MKTDTTTMIFEQLRKGTVPDEGHGAFAVGIEPVINELLRNLESVSNGEKKGNIKFLRGNYGCGKTFVAKYTLSLAREKGFVTSFVVISPNDTQFHNFQVVYHKICQNLHSNSAKSVGVIADALDRWFGLIEDSLINIENLSYDDPKFDDAVINRFETELVSLLKDDVSQDFLSVIRAYFIAKQEGDVAKSGQLLSWLSGSPNVSAQAKKSAGIKGEIDSKTALTYLKGILSILNSAGYKGLMIVLDEMETILRERRDVREKSMTGLRQITDAVEGFRGSLWVFTGTEEFFDSPKGVKGLQPLHDRIGFQRVGEFVSLKQAQLELKPMNHERLLNVSIRLRDLYNPSENKDRLNQVVDKDFLEKFVNLFTDGFKGQLGVVPRIYIRSLINIFDLVVENEDFDPKKELKLPDDAKEELAKASRIADDVEESPYAEVSF